MENGNGISLLDLFSMFPDDATAERWLEEEKWGKTVNGLPGRTPGLPASIFCPHCGCFDRITPCRNRGNRPYWCGDCRKHFSVRTEGMMSHSKVPYRKWAIAVHLHLSRPQGISSRQLARDLGITQKTAWSMLHRLRECWPDPGPLRCRIAEIDEAWFGGKDEYRHADKKFGDNWRKGRVCAGGIIDRETGRGTIEVIQNTERETLFGLAEKNVRPEGTLFSDNAAVYRDGFGWPGRHETVTHKGEYVRGDVHTNTIESFWAEAKGTIKTYRHASPKHYPRYFKEIVGRHNVRIDGMALLDQMELLASGMVGKRLTYRDLVDTEIPPEPFTHHRWKEGEPFRKFRK